MENSDRLNENIACSCDISANTILKGLSESNYQMAINLNLLVPHPAFLCLYLASSVSDPNDGCCNGERMESSAKQASPEEGRVSSRATI